MTAVKLTQDELMRLLDFIKTYVAEHGIGPSYEEMAEAMGVSAAAVRYRLVRLHSQRLIKWEKGFIRTLEVL